MRRRGAIAAHSQRGQSPTIDAGAAAAQEVALDGAAGWKPWTVWTAMAATLATVLAGRALVRDGGDPRPGVVIGLIMLNLLCVGLAVLVAAAHGKVRDADFGLQRPRLLPRAAGLTIAIGVGLFVFSAAWAQALGLGDDAPSISDRLVADESTSQALLVLFLVAVATPLGEEFIFRGYVFRALSNWRGTLPAAALTGLGFAAFHVGWLPIGAFVPVAVFGFGLCLLYHWTGSLYPSLAFHALFNSLLAARVLGPTWQNLLAVAFAVVGTLVIARLVAVLLGDGPSTLD